MFLFRIVIFVVGIILSVSAAVWVYEPVNTVVEGMEWMYLKVRAFEDTLNSGTDSFIDNFQDKYDEISRLFGREVAEEQVKNEVLQETEEGRLMDAFFEKDIALWISTFVGLLVLSLYFNMISFFTFLLKPVLFFVPKK